jgi:hypothetical protein
LSLRSVAVRESVGRASVRRGRSALAATPVVVLRRKLRRVSRAGMDGGI